jgi:ACS family hexuronate transporter-like MFS transporter
MRWTICAMLFVATSINYMDRQVIAILKPTLEHSIGLTELDYGYIVDAFQIAYALGLLAAGRVIDRLGTRIGYMLVMAVWSVSAMSHALASTALEFGIARLSLGFGESGNFPAAIKTVAEWFPQSERSLATGIFNSGANLGAILAPLLVPWVTLRYGWHVAFLTTGLFSALWILWWFRRYRRPGDHSALTGGELRPIDSPAAAAREPAVEWRRLLSVRQTWAFSIAKFFTDPIWYFYLFWLPSYFSAKFHRNLSHLGLPLIIVYNVSVIGSIGGGWLPSPFRHLGLSSGTARLAAMLVCAFALVPIYSASSVKSVWIAIALISLAAGAHQGWSAVHSRIGYVSAQRGRFGGRYRRHGRIDRQRAVCLLRRPCPRTDTKLCQSFRYCSQRLPAGAGRSLRARSGTAKGGALGMSLHRATGDRKSNPGGPKNNRRAGRWPGLRPGGLRTDGEVFPGHTHSGQARGAGHHPRLEHGA